MTKQLEQQVVFFMIWPSNHRLVLPSVLISVRRLGVELNYKLTAGIKREKEKLQKKWATLANVILSLQLNQLFTLFFRDKQYYSCKTLCLMHKFILQRTESLV